MPRRPRLPGLDLLQHCRQPVSLDQPLSGKQLIENHTETVDVGAGIDAVAFAARLLGTHVERRAREGRPLAEVLFAQGQPEIGHHRVALDVEQDVGRLDVPVNQVALVRVVQGFGHAGNQWRRCGRRKPGFAQLPGQVAPRHELRDYITGTVLGTADVVNGNDPRVVQAGQHARLGQVKPVVIGRSAAVGLVDLDGHLTAQIFIVAAVDDPEAARPQPRCDPVTTQPERQNHLIRAAGTADLRGQEAGVVVRPSLLTQAAAVFDIQLD